MAYSDSWGTNMPGRMGANQPAEVNTSATVDALLVQALESGRETILDNWQGDERALRYRIEAAAQGRKYDLVRVYGDWRVTFSPA